MYDATGPGTSVNHQLAESHAISGTDTHAVPSNRALVLMVGANMEHGGQQQHLLDLAPGLQDLTGRQVVVATPGGRLVTELLNRGVRHEPIPGMNHNPATVLKTARRIDKLARQYGALIIHSHTRYHNLTSLLAVTLFRTPAVRVATAHNVFPDKHWSGFWPRHTICVSRPVQDYVRLYSRAETRVIFDGVPSFQNSFSREEARAALDLHDDEVVVLHVGRLATQKSQNLLVDAFALASAKDNVPRLRLILVGDGPLRQSLEKQIERSPYKNRIKLMGDLPRETVGRLMKAADVLALSSLWEGLGMVLIEAASEGLPLVSFKVGGVTDVVRDGETGLLVAPKDVNGLCDAIVMLSRDPTLRTRLGSAAKLVYRQCFTLEKCIKDTDMFYEDILGGILPG